MKTSDGRKSTVGSNPTLAAKPKMGQKYICVTLAYELGTLGSRISLVRKNREVQPIKHITSGSRQIGYSHHPFTVEFEGSTPFCLTIVLLA